MLARLRAAWRRLRAGRGGYRAELERICMGDAERMRRLIEFEQRRAPGISEAEACRRAVATYRADNR